MAAPLLLPNPSPPPARDKRRSHSGIQSGPHNPPDAVTAFCPWTEALDQLDTHCGSLPARERGLKPDEVARGEADAESLPARERGLKPLSVSGRRRR